MTNPESIEVKAPEGYTIDLEKSCLESGKISFKKKELTYQEILNQLFLNKKSYYIGSGGKSICKADSTIEEDVKDMFTSTSRERLQRLNNLNKLINVAEYLNSTCTDTSAVKHFIVLDNKGKLDFANYRNISDMNIFFKTKELAQQAIDLLGEHCIISAMKL